MKKLLLLICGNFLAISPSFSQTFLVRNWVATYSSVDSIFNSATAVDGNGNIIVAGYSTTTSNGDDFTTIKYNAFGDTIWVRKYNGPANGNDQIKAMAVDGMGNIYITGSSEGILTGNDWVTIMYNAAGVPIWATRYDFTGLDDSPSSIVAGPTGNVYVAGYQTKTGQGKNFRVAQYNAIGMETGNFDHDGTANEDDFAASLAINQGGTLIYATGTVRDSVTGDDIFTVSFNFLGFSLLQSNQYNGTFSGDDRGNAVKLDQLGHPYVAGSSESDSADSDFITIKYDTINLTPVWTKKHDGYKNNDAAWSLAYDIATNEIIVTGRSTVSSSDIELHTVKYDSAGTEQWVQTYSVGNILGATMPPPRIVIDVTGHLYISGHKHNGSSSDYIIIRYAPSGTEQFVELFNGVANGEDKPSDIAVDNMGMLYITGQSYNGSNYDFCTIKYSQLPVYFPPDANNEPLSNSGVFWENRGQLTRLDTDTLVNLVPEIKFYAGFSKALYFSDSITSYVFSTTDNNTATTDTMYRLDMRFSGANPTRAYWYDRVSNYRNYFLSHCPDGITRVKGYKQLFYPQIYKNIDLHYSSNTAGLKYHLVMFPGADTSDIKIVYDGADSIVTIGGKLFIYTKLGTIIQDKIHAYQDNFNNTIIPVTFTPGYVVSGDTVTFSLGIYNPTLPLILQFDWGPDPNPAHIQSPEYSTTFGGIGYDEGTGVTTDDDGNSYWCGFTASDHFTFPQLTGIQQTFGGTFDCYITRFNTAVGPYPSPVADKKEWTTYWGGTGDDRAFAIASTGNGNSGKSYITGYTSTSGFPIINASGSYNQSNNAGGKDAFVIKIDNQTGGISLNLWSTNFGGSGDDIGYTIKLDASDNIFIGGSTGSTNYSSTSCGVPGDNNFPKCTTWSSYNNGNAYGGGTTDGFLARFNNSGAITWSTFYGGDKADAVLSLVLDANGKLYFTGRTEGGTFPIQSLTGAYNQTAFGGGMDAFITRFESSGVYSWSTYLGGSDDDDARTIMVNSTNQVFVAGSTKTSSASTNLCGVPGLGEFPLCNEVGATYDGTHNGGYDGYFLKFNTSNALVWGTYYGGTGDDWINAIAINGNNDLFFTGRTLSTSTFPTQTSLDYGSFFTNSLGVIQGPSDAILGHFNSADVKRWSTYHSNEPGFTSNTGDECGNAIAIYDGTSPNFGNFFYTTGWTTSGDFHLMDFDSNGECCQNAWEPKPYANATDPYMTRFSLAPMWHMSVENIEETYSINATVYPNPTSYYIEVELKIDRVEDIRVNLLSSTGQLLSETTIKSENGIVRTRLDISLFSSGLYFLNIVAGDKKATKKIIIDK